HGNFEGAAQRKVYALVGAAAAVAAAVGPLLGGFITTYLSWRVAFAGEAVIIGGVVLGILVWQEGGESVGALLLLGAAALTGLVLWLRRRKRAARPTLLDPDLFS